MGGEVLHVLSEQDSSTLIMSKTENRALERGGCETFHSDYNATGTEREGD